MIIDKRKRRNKMFELKDATMIYDMDKEEKVYAMKSMNVSRIKDW